MADINITIKSMLEKGQDPKDILIEYCKPQCAHWTKRLEKCEDALRNLEASDPEKTCMYPARDQIACIESCVR